MSIHKILLLDDEDLLNLLNENGYKDIAEILKGRNINGRTFLELSEYQTKCWWLSPQQKNQVFSFIEEIKKNPSIILKGLKLTTNSPSRTQTNQIVHANNQDFRKLLDLTLGLNNNSPPVRSKIPSPLAQKELPIESDQQFQNKRNHPVSFPNKFKPLLSEDTLPRYNRPEVAPGDPKSTPTDNTSRHPVRANIITPTRDHAKEGSQKFTRSRAHRPPPPPPDETYINMANISSIQGSHAYSVQGSHSYSHNLNINQSGIYERTEVKRVDCISNLPSPDARYLTKQRRIQNPNDEYEYMDGVKYMPPNEEDNKYLNVPATKTRTLKMSSSLNNLLKLPINTDIADEDKLKTLLKPTTSLGNFRAISPNCSRKQIHLNKDYEKYLAKERPPLPLPATTKSLESLRVKNHIDGPNKNYDAVLKKPLTKSNGHLEFLGENSAPRTKLTPSPTSETKRIVDDSTSQMDTEEISKPNILERIKKKVSKKHSYENYKPEIKKEILKKEKEKEIKVLYKNRPLPDVPINSKVRNDANSPTKPESYCDFRKEKLKMSVTYDKPFQQQKSEEEKFYKNNNIISNGNISNHYSEDLISQSPISHVNDLARKLSDELKIRKLNDNNAVPKEPFYVNLNINSTYDSSYDDDTDYDDDNINQIVDSPNAIYSECYTIENDDEKFFRNTTREGAKLLLQNLPDGAFLFRPSEHYFRALTVKFKGKCYNLGIERIENKLRLNSDTSSVSPTFDTLGALVNYFTKEVVSFRNGDDAVEIHLNPVLPDHLI